MTYIIAEPCVGTCDTACVEVCPVDCIHGPYDKEGAGAETKTDGLNRRIKICFTLILRNVLIAALVNRNVRLKPFLKKVKFLKNGITLLKSIMNGLVKKLQADLIQNKLPIMNGCLKTAVFFDK
tara:strand:+ start:193 stop:564 length:372 start_codon:yes stop_codon:yes gene_type:complete